MVDSGSLFRSPIENMRVAAVGVHIPHGNERPETASHCRENAFPSVGSSPARTLEGGVFRDGEPRNSN